MKKVLQIICIILLILILILGYVKVNYAFISDSKDIYTLANQAIAEKNKKRCSKIVNVYFYEGLQFKPKASIINACYEIYGVKTGDVTACDMMSLPSSGCYTSAATKNKNISLCEKIDSTLWTHDQCVMYMVSVLGDTSFCTRVNTDKAREECPTIKKDSRTYFNNIDGLYR
jgi:hypothetical protein